MGFKMATHLLSRLNSFFSVSTQLLKNQVNGSIKIDHQVRYKWADWRMMKDNKKRKCLVQYAPERMRITALRKNDILPIEIKVKLLLQTLKNFTKPISFQIIVGT